MITKEQIQQNKIRYLELLAKLNIDLTEFSTYLDACGYFYTPYTTQYFRAYEGGLCQTALDLYDALKAQADRYFPGRYTEQDIIKVALFKNIYRAEMYEYVNGVYRTKKYRPTFGDLGLSSFMIIREFRSQIDLTDEQVMCICHGSASDNSIDIYDIRQSYPLVALTMIAETLITSFKRE